jgi:hypothetical protein
MKTSTNVLKWIATTIALVVDECLTTDEDHHLVISRNGTALSLTWNKGYSYLESVVNISAHTARHEDRGVLCAMLALDVAEMSRREAYPQIPCKLTTAEQDLCHGKQYIQAIKALRERYSSVGVSLSLRDAKASVDAYRREAGLDSASKPISPYPGLPQ